MPNNVNDMEKFLQLMKQAALSGKTINNRLVYGSLVRFGRKVVNDENINRNFDDWIKNFKDVDNISVFVSPNWKYFCQFTNDNEYFNPNKMIKMYIPVDDEHINEAAKRIFKFMAKNKIIHHSKIGSAVRNDDIVIRINRKEDAEKIRDFVMNDEYIKSGLMKPNPFSFNDGSIAYAWDGMKSYNSTVADFIVMYINRLKKYNMLDSVSYRDFYIFVANTYKDVFQNGNGMIDFLNNLDDDINYDYATNLANYEGITNMMLTALQPHANSVNAFFQKYDEVGSLSRQQKVANKMQKLLDNMRDDKKSNEDTHEYKPVRSHDYEIKKYASLWEKIYPVLVHKYGYMEADFRLLRIIQTGNYDFLTRDGNVRLMVKNSGMTKELLRDLMIKVKRDKANLIYNASLETLNKYHPEQIRAALLDGQAGYYQKFTKAENREKLRSKIQPGELRGIITSSLLDAGYEPEDIPDDFGLLIKLYVNGLGKQQGYTRG